jgi:two-component system NarL family response regulator
LFAEPGGNKISLTLCLAAVHQPAVAGQMRGDWPVMATRILLVDDHRVVVEGLGAMLDKENELEVVGMAEDGRVAMSMVAELKPDLVVMDIGMPGLNGIEATSRIVQDHPRTRVLALSTYTDKKYVRAMLEAGAHAYVTKKTAGSELLDAIRKARHGMKYLSSDITGSVVEGFVSREVDAASALDRLGGREREVLQMIAEGLTSGEIAAKLHVSTNTVDTHRRNLMKKLDLHSVAELTKYAVCEGLTTLDD